MPQDALQHNQGNWRNLPARLDKPSHPERHADCLHVFRQKSVWDLIPPGESHPTTLQCASSLRKLPGRRPAAQAPPIRHVDQPADSPRHRVGGSPPRPRGNHLRCSAPTPPTPTDPRKSVPRALRLAKADIGIHASVSNPSGTGARMASRRP